MPKSKMKIQGNDLYFKLLLLFPVFTLFQSFPGFGWINRILFFLTVVVQLALQINTAKLKRNWLVVLFVLALVHVHSLFQTSFPLHNTNLIFYFFFWVLLAMYFAEIKDRLPGIIKKNIKYIRAVIVLWTAVVGVSIFLPSSYVRYYAWGGSTYFVSITGAAFRLAPTALMISTLVLVYYCFTREKKSIVFLIVPLYCFMMCGSRTYLGVGLLVILVYWYIYTPKKLYFGLSLIPLGALFIYLIMNSAALDKILATTGTGYYDYWGKLTNGRSIFWKIDLQQFSANSILNQLFGCGLNYSYEVTELYYTAAHWAHNDFIEVLLSFGYTGLVLYIYTVVVLMKKYIRNASLPVIVVGFTILIWFINAFFNMFYTYTCSMVCFPIMLAALNYYFKEDNHELEQIKTKMASI